MVTKMANDKMTQKKAIEFILANATVNGEPIPADVENKLKEMKDALEKRAKAPRAPSAEVKENAKLREAILANMESGKLYSIPDLIAKVPELATASSHKVSALLTPLKNDGKVVREEIKRKAYFRLAD